MSEDKVINSNKYLTFSVGKEIFGLDIKHVDDIIGIQDITVVPEQPEYIKGVINLRGKIIPTMDVRARFKKEDRVYDDRTCIVVLNMQNTSVGVIVDRVVEVLDIDEDQISEPPRFSDEYQSNYISGIGKINEEIAMLLDCNKLLNYDQIEALNHMQQAAEEGE
jgi:purine-binding chemotaxis protein CheW